MQCVILKWILSLQKILLHQLVKLECDLWTEGQECIKTYFLVLLVVLQSVGGCSYL